MTVWTPHHVLSFLESKQNVTTSGHAHKDPPDRVATLLPNHEVLDQIYSRCKDLQSEPLSNAEEVWFVDGSCIMEN